MFDVIEIVPIYDGSDAVIGTEGYCIATCPTAEDAFRVASERAGEVGADEMMISHEVRKDGKRVFEKYDEINSDCIPF